MRNSIKALCVAGLSLALASPAFGAAKIYSSIRYDTFYVNQKSDGATNAANDDSATTLINEVAGNSRVGVKFSEGNLSGQWEMGLPGSNTRLAYGVYTFSGGNVLVGQTYTPWTMFSDQAYGADNGNIGFGALYDGRQPQIKLTFGGFYLAFVKTNTPAPYVGTTTTSLGSVTTSTGHVVGLSTVTTITDVQYTVLPKIGIGYNGKAGNATFGAGFAYNTFKEKNDAYNVDVDRDAYLAYARSSVKFGSVTVKGQVHYGQNLAIFGISGRSASTPVLTWSMLTGANLDDTKAYGGFVQVSAAMGPTVAMNAGAGFTRDERGNTDYDQTTIFVNAPIEIAPGFHIVPELDYFHYNNQTTTGLVPSVGLPTKDAYAVGAKWQMDF